VTKRRTDPCGGIAAASTRLLLIVLLGAAPLLAPTAAEAQHIDWTLGSEGLLSQDQPPPGLYYSNEAVYYWASGDRALRALSANANLDIFLDFNTLLWVSRWKLLGANFGMDASIPLVNTNGSLDITALEGRIGLSRGSSEFGLSSIYVEPINLGWHLPRYDVTAAFGFFAPAGGYNPNRVINTGLGRWAEMISLGGVAYLDEQRAWYLDGWTRYLTHQGQQGIDLRVGDDFILEWGAGRTFATGIGPVNAGLVGYAYWQTTDTTGSAIPTGTLQRRGSVYALGPEVNATTKYGQFFLRFYSEFGGANTPQGQTVMIGFVL
jgi:hypothetical protein